MVLLSRFYYLLAMGIFSAVVSQWWLDGRALAETIALFVSASVVADFIFIPNLALTAQRAAPTTVQQGRAMTVLLTLTNCCQRQAQFTVLDSPPPHFTPQPKEESFTLAKGDSIARSYTLLSYQRGSFPFGALYYKIRGPLGLVQRTALLSLPATIRVVPDLGLGSDELHGVVPRPVHIGAHQSRFGGQGQEFESLREHHQDDDWRHIDWKASAKRGQWIQRQYEVEQDQRLLILIDAGRLLATQIGHYRKIDYSINTSLRLAQISRKKGDLLGYAAFNDQLLHYSMPHRRPQQISDLVEILTNLQPKRVESDYLTVFHNLSHRLPSSTLVVCFTDLSDTASAETYLQAARLLMLRHRLITVTISDSGLLALTKHLPKDEREIFRYIAATELWNDYQRAHAHLHTLGTTSVSVPAEQLTLATINAYLRIRASASRSG